MESNFVIIKGQPYYSNYASVAYLDEVTFLNYVILSPMHQNILLLSFSLMD